MNYYQHHIGDFDKTTRHLTRIERSIYRDLIELYYDTEQPLTLDRTALCRKILARSNEESTAVEQVLNEFFTETAIGWYHARCESEIERYHNSSSQKAQAGKASALKRAEKLQQALNEISTDVEQPLNDSSTNQQPITVNHEPVNPAPKKPARFDPMAIDLPDGIPADAWGRWITYRRQRKLSTTEQTAFAQIEKLVAWRGKGHSPPKIIDESIANGWQGLFEPKVGGTNNASSRESVIAAFTGSGQRQPAILEGYSERLVGSG